MNYAINVKSEIGTLKKVLLKRPGKELDHLSPNTLERLLFDDIPFLDTAQEEHDAFAQVLRDRGVEVVYLTDLVAESIDGNTQLKKQFIDEFVENSGDRAIMYKQELSEYLLNIGDTRTMVDMTMVGINSDDVSFSNKSPLSKLVGSDSHFILDPIPNLYFTRDPFAFIGNGVSLNHMYSQTRNRETLYGKYILENHPDYAGKVKFYYRPDDKFHIEGGDILNLNENVIAVGISQRTTPEAIENLARSIFADEEATIKTVLAFEIPAIRAYMHLDTVFTQVDYDKFTVHPGIIDYLKCFAITPNDHGDIKVEELHMDLDQVLCKYLGVDKVSLIKCGGANKIASEREQWNDGSNTLCISPGVAVVYDRNHTTNNLLQDSGVEIIKIRSSELSRGRGGPRCMSMPIVRG